MKKLLSGLVLILVVLAAGIVMAEDPGDHALSCTYCGMDLHRFAHSHMVVEYEDGGSVETCSIHCLALEFANAIDRAPKRILVGDYNTRELIAADSAVWVIGGDQPGVMTRNPKWAFADKGAAQQFIATHGGELADFNQAMRAAYVDMYEDTLQIRKMRQMKKMKMHKMQ